MLGLTKKQINRRHGYRGSWSSTSSGETDFESDNEIKEQATSDKDESFNLSSLSTFSLANRIWTSTGNFLGWHEPASDSDSGNTPPLKKTKNKRKLTFLQSVKVVLIPSMAEYNKAELTPLMWWCDADYRTFKHEAISEIRAVMREKECSVKEASVTLYQTPTPTYASGRYHSGNVNPSANSTIDVVDFIPICNVPVVPLEDPSTCSGRFSPTPVVPEVEELANSTEMDVDDKEENKENINSADSVVSVAVAGKADAEVPVKKTLGLHLDPSYMEQYQLDAFTAAEIVSPQRIATSNYPPIRIQVGQVVAHLPPIQNARSLFGRSAMGIESPGGADLQVGTQQTGSLFEGISF